MSDHDVVPIGEIGNHYGGLYVKAEGGKYYWSIEDWSGFYWEQIPKKLYDALISYTQETTP